MLIGAGAQPKERYRVLLSDAVSSQHAMLAIKLNDRVTSGRVHVGEFGFCVAFVLFSSDNHDVDVDDGDGERFPPVQDLRVLALERDGDREVRGVRYF